MKITTALLLAISVMLITFSKSIIILQYELNKKYIASTLCENRDKPMSHCNGSCHLKKNLNNDGQKENSSSGTVKSTLEIELFSMPSENTIYNEGMIQSSCNIYTSAVTIEPYFSIFHPPKAA